MIYVSSIFLGKFVLNCDEISMYPIVLHLLFDGMYSTHSNNNLIAGNPLQCYQCDSEKGEKCGDPFNNNSTIKKENCTNDYPACVVMSYQRGTSTTILEIIYLERIVKLILFFFFFFFFFFQQMKQRNTNDVVQICHLVRKQYWIF